MSISVSVLFCDDIRSESSGNLSAMGIYTGEVKVQGHKLDRLGVLVMLKDIDNPLPSEFSVFIKGSEGKVLELNAKSGSASQNQDKSGSAPFVIRSIPLLHSEELLQVIVRIGGEDIIAGDLKLVRVEGCVE